MNFQMTSGRYAIHRSITWPRQPTHDLQGVSKRRTYVGRPEILLEKHSDRSVLSTWQTEVAMITDVVLEGIAVRVWKYADYLLFAWRAWDENPSARPNRTFATDHIIFTSSINGTFQLFSALYHRLLGIISNLQGKSALLF